MSTWLCYLSWPWFYLTKSESLFQDRMKSVRIRRFSGPNAGKYGTDMAYSRSLLGATFAPNLAALVLEKIFSSEMVKDGFCLWGAIKPNVLFSENVL